MQKALNWWKDGPALAEALEEGLGLAAPGPGPLRPALLDMVTKRRIHPATAENLDALGIPTFAGFIALGRLIGKLPKCDLPARGLAPPLSPGQLASLATRACASAVGAAPLWSHLAAPTPGAQGLPGLAKALAHGAALAVAERLAPARPAPDPLMPARRLTLELLSRGRAKPEALAMMTKGDRAWLAWRLESALPWVAALAPAARQSLLARLLPAAAEALRAAHPLEAAAFDARLKAAVGGGRGTRPLG